MEITAINIYGFGSLANHQVTFNRNLQVIMGRNESGKTTIYAFILGVLFGFPAKSKSAPSYESNWANVFGGSVSLMLSTKELVRVERFRKNGATTVAVYFSSGKVGTEDDLKEILQGIDRNFYEKIFAFNLDGLQEVYKLDEKKVGDFLFYTSIAGSDRLFKIRDSLNKKANAYFKRTGRNPILNIKLDELMKKKKELAEASAKEREYESLCSSLKDRRYNLKCCEEELKKLTQNKVKYAEHLRLAPLWYESKALKTRLHEMGDINFLQDWRARLNDLNNEIKQQKLFITKYEQDKKSLDEKISKIVVNEIVLKEAIKIEECRILATKIEELESQCKEDTVHLETYSRQIKELSAELYLNFSENEIKNIDTSFVIKGEIKDLEKKWRDLTTDFEKDTCSLEKIAADLPILQTKIDEKAKDLQLQKVRQIKSQIRPKKLLDFVSLIFLVIGLISFYTTRPMWLTTSFFVITFLAMFSSQFFRSQKINNHNGQFQGSASSLDEQTIHDKVYLEQLQINYNKLQEKLEISKRALEEAETHRLYIVQKLRLPNEIGFNMLLEAYEKLVSLKKIHFEYANKSCQLENKKNLLTKYFDFIAITANNCNILWHSSEKLYAVMNNLNQELENERVNKSRLVTLEEKADETKESLNRHMMALSKFCDEKRQLLSLAKCNDEETFLHMESLFNERQEKLERLSLLQSQIAHFDFFDLTTKEVEENLNQTCLKINNLNELIKNLQQEVAKLKQEIIFLEKSGTVEKKSLQYYKLLEEFLGDAYEWMKIVIAKGILDKVATYVTDEKLPAIMTAATANLRFLTEEEYINIKFSSESKSLVLVRKDETEVMPVDLSRGTSEMLYVALRLAFIEKLSFVEEMPIIIDDSFVNFDKYRLLRIIELIKLISKGRQVILFTCHEHIAAHFHGDVVKQIGNGISVSEAF